MTEPKRCPWCDSWKPEERRYSPLTGRECDNDTFHSTPARCAAPAPDGSGTCHLDPGHGTEQHETVPEGSRTVVTWDDAPASEPSREGDRVVKNTGNGSDLSSQGEGSDAGSSPAGRPFVTPASDPTKLHILYCDEYHAHTPPRCCASDCWCRDDTPTSEPPLLKDINTEWVTEKNEGDMTVHHLMVGGVLCRWWGDGPEPSGVARLAALVSGDTTPETPTPTPLSAQEEYESIMVPVKICEAQIDEAVVKAINETDAKWVRKTRESQPIVVAEAEKRLGSAWRAMALYTVENALVDPDEPELFSPFDTEVRTIIRNMVDEAVRLEAKRWLEVQLMGNRILIDAKTEEVESIRERAAEICKAAADTLFRQRNAKLQPSLWDVLITVSSDILSLKADDDG